MATLVLSTVGTVLGGPVGSAIGALIGQSIDQELLAPVRRGPRIGDLTVQTSSYGTQIPRIYGSMRVAGSVIWSTDLIERTQSGGAKGQPDVTYSYAVSLAVALSSRPAGSIGRIWADGKLLRGTAGDFKVQTSFRFYEGSEYQIIDPLIASIEGIKRTPGYRGLAIAVFEDLELAEFGNRIPFLTFEIIADEAPVTCGTILADASDGAVSTEADQQLIGFAAYGPTIRNSIEPLVESFGLSLFDDGEKLRGPATNVASVVEEDEFGYAQTDQSSPRFRRERSTHAAPASIRLTYYDPARDYQTGEARASSGEQSGKERQQDLAAVLGAGDAKALAHEMLARSWAECDKLTLHLPPSRLAIEPGSAIQLPLNPPLWTVERASTDGFVVVAELRPSSNRAAAVTAEPGRVASSPDVVAGPVALALADLPDVTGTSANEPFILLAASSASAGWKPKTAEITFGGQSIATRTARIKSVLGEAASALPAAACELIDQQNSVEVVLVDPDQWLTSCDDAGLGAGDNLALLGAELIQFGVAAPLGDGRFRLSRLLRGRGGSEWACSGHAAGDAFCLLQPGALEAIALPRWAIGSSVTVALAGASASISFGGEALRPPSPVDLIGERLADGSLKLSWIRRSRQGFAWIDGVDAPLGETFEQYRITLTGNSGVLESTAAEPAFLISATEVSSVGPGPAVIEVRQIGDFAVSRTAQLNIDLN